MVKRKKMPYLPNPLMPAEPRLRHRSLKCSIGSLRSLEFRSFLHFCLICESDLDVAAMFLSFVRNKYGALWKSRRLYFFRYPDNDRSFPVSLVKKKTVGAPLQFLKSIIYLFIYLFCFFSSVSVVNTTTRRK